METTKITRAMADKIAAPATGRKPDKLRIPAGRTNPQPEAGLQTVEVVLAATLWLSLALAGCATVHQTYAPDGRLAFALNCSGTARGWDKCLSAAGQQCGAAGYDILDRSDEPLHVGSATIGQSGGSAFGVSTRERTMLIACKK